MALKLQLEGTSPGSGILTIVGAGFPAGPFQLSIQRNQDEQYLATGNRWQSTPFWHWVGDVKGQPDQLEATLGSELIDGLVLSAGMMFVVAIKTEGYQGQQVLKISGRLLGSGAAGPGAAAVPDSGPPPIETTAQPEPEVPPLPQPTPEPEPVAVETEAEAGITLPPEQTGPAIAEDPVSDEEDEGEAEVEPKQPGLLRRFGYLWLFLILLLGAAAALYYWLPVLWPGADSGENAEPTVAESLPAVTGRARASAFLNQTPKPTPAEILQAAESWEQQRDCEGVKVLLNLAAASDSRLALSLAQLNDPQYQAQRPCGSEDLETAAYWYERPAEEGDGNAQARLGNILTEHYHSGPLFDKGLQYLQKAAKNGDQAAAERLKTLGE